MTKDMIRYDLLAQDALRGVVRKVMSDAARMGLPGEHHFYIAFDTNFSGVRMSQRLREQYPKEMTIVLQHQFWDLTVSDQAFEVGLSFGNVPERLLVPFESVKGFFDPSVQFGLQFEVLESDEDEDGEITEHVSANDTESVTLKLRKDIKDSAKKPGKKTAKGAASEPDAFADGDVPQIKPKAKTGKKTPPPEGAGAEVVSLDQFRKPKS